MAVVGFKRDRGDTVGQTTAGRFLLLLDSMRAEQFPILRSGDTGLDVLLIDTCPTTFAATGYVTGHLGYSFSTNSPTLYR